MAQRRTTHRSSKGTKLYAVRKADGTFADVQTYKRAHGADVRKRAKGESSASKVAKAAKKTVKKAASAGSSMLGKARKAVGGMLKKVAAKKTPRKRAAKKATRKTARKRA